MTEITDNGGWMKQKALANGFTYDDVAFALKRNRSTIHRWFKKNNLNATKMKLVADVIGIDLRLHFENFDFLYEKPNKVDYRLKYLDLLEKNVLLEEELNLYKNERK